MHGSVSECQGHANTAVAVAIAMFVELAVETVL